jgi:hypothetical protein
LRHNRVGALSIKIVGCDKVFQVPFAFGSEPLQLYGVTRRRFGQGTLNSPVKLDDFLSRVILNSTGLNLEKIAHKGRFWRAVRLLAYK